MNKICTSLEQSKKLIELGIDVNTADMSYEYQDECDGNFPYYSIPVCYPPENSKDIPCWSLAALLGVIDNTKDEVAFYDLQHDMILGWKVEIQAEEWNYDVGFFENPVDACYEMIVKLKEMKLL